MKMKKQMQITDIYGNSAISMIFYFKVDQNAGKCPDLAGRKQIQTFVDYLKSYNYNETSRKTGRNTGTSPVAEKGERDGTDEETICILIKNTEGHIIYRLLAAR